MVAALSFVMLFIERMARIVDENSELHPPESSAPPYSTPEAEADSTAVAPAAPSALPAIYSFTPFWERPKSRGQRGGV